MPKKLQATLQPLSADGQPDGESRRIDVTESVLYMDVDEVRDLSNECYNGVYYSSPDRSDEEFVDFDVSMSERDLLDFFEIQSLGELTEKNLKEKQESFLESKVLGFGPKIPEGFFHACRSAWIEAQNLFLELSNSVYEEGGELRMIQKLDDTGNTRWSIQLDGSSRVGEIKDMAMLVIPALERLEKMLPLARDPENDVFETLTVSSSQNGKHMFLSVDNALGLKESAEMMLGYESAVDFFHARTSYTGDSQFDVLARNRLVRGGTFYGDCLIEPACRPFVEYFESQGFEPRQSCSGHPRGFDFVWQYPTDPGSVYDVIQILKVPGIKIEPFTSMMCSGPALKMTLEKEPETYAERDQKLRDVFEALKSLDLCQEPKTPTL